VVGGELTPDAPRPSSSSLFSDAVLKVELGPHFFIDLEFSSLARFFTPGRTQAYAKLRSFEDGEVAD